MGSIVIHVWYSEGEEATRANSGENDTREYEDQPDVVDLPKGREGERQGNDNCVHGFLLSVFTFLFPSSSQPPSRELGW